MNPILFSENSTTFTTNGIGRLSDAISCVVTEERNGQYELEMEYPIDGQHFGEIGIRSIIGAVPCDGGSIQAFRVYKMTKPISGRVKINAQHISYDLSKNTSMPFSITSSSSACSQALAGLKSHAVETCPFTFWTDVTTAGSYSQSAPASIKSRLGGVEGSVLDQFGGEYEWDNFTVKLHRQRGSLAELNGLTLRYGKNITDITQEENIASTATGAVPYWQDYEGDLVTLPEQAVYSQYASRYSQHLTVPLDLSEKFDDKPTVEALRAAANVVVNASEFGLPKVSIEVSFVALWQTEEYKDIAPLQRVKLCDEVTVSFEKLGVDVTAKVVKTVYDVLAERYQSIQIGSVRSNLAMTLTDQNAQTLRQIEAQAVSVETAINNATKWLTTAGGYVIAIRNADGSWKELIFSNMTDPYDASAKLLRVNNNGIGFSTHGMEGPFTNAWTIDGHLVADFLFGGTLTLGGKGTSYDGTPNTDNNRGWLKLLNSSNQQIGKWDMNGIEVKTGVIAGPTVKAGGTNNTSGLLQILNANDTQIGKWDKDGIDVKSGIIAGPTVKAGGNNNASGLILILNASGAEIGRWDKDGINVKSGVIAGPTLKAGGNANASGFLQILNASGTQIGKWDKDGISVLAGLINGASINLGGANNASGTITIKNASGNTIGTWNNGGIDVKKGSINGPSITLGGNNNASGTLTIKDANGNTIGTWTKDGINITAGSFNINNAFKVSTTGHLDATGATITGSITSTGDNRSSSLSGGKLEIYTPSGGVYDQLLMQRGSEYIEMGAIRAFSNISGESADWTDIIHVAKMYHDHGGWWS